MKYVLLASLLLTCAAVEAADPADNLRMHLEEMKKHLAVMQKYENLDYQCADLVEHANQMTLHMEQMTQMMVKMHNTTATHEMQHEDSASSESK